MVIRVITISDRASEGIYDDVSGPVIERILREKISLCSVSRQLVPDERKAIMDALQHAADVDVIITSGSTGISQRDVAPEVTTEYCDRLIPGIAEFLRNESLRETPYAVLSRGVAGMKGKTVIINLPGSVKAADFCTRLIVPLLVHSVAMAANEGHCRKE